MGCPRAGCLKGRRSMWRGRRPVALSPGRTGHPPGHRPARPRRRRRRKRKRKRPAPPPAPPWTYRRRTPPYGIPKAWDPAERRPPRRFRRRRLPGRPLPLEPAAPQRVGVRRPRGLRRRGRRPRGRRFRGGAPTGRTLSRNSSDRSRRRGEPVVEGVGRGRWSRVLGGVVVQLPPPVVVLTGGRLPLLAHAPNCPLVGPDENGASGKTGPWRGCRTAVDATVTQAW